MLWWRENMTKEVVMVRRREPGAAPEWRIHQEWLQDVHTETEREEPVKNPGVSAVK
jgi:hypothetical protein